MAKAKDFHAVLNDTSRPRTPASWPRPRTFMLSLMTRQGQGRGQTSP